MLGLDPWQPFGEVRSKEPFDGDAAVVWLLLRHRGLPATAVTVLNGFAYLASLGFRERSPLLRRLAPALLGLDAAARALAPLLGVRIHAVWEREAAG